MKIVSIVSHDAGGAENISSWVLKQKTSFFFVLKGPALKIFSEKIKNLKIISLEKALKISDVLICGTSWESEIENEAIKKGNKKNKITIAFLDHWVNYKERFLYKGKLNLPSILWVSDNYAYEIAKKIFPKIKIELKTNYYIENIIESFSKINKPIKNKNWQKVLFTAENIKKHALLKFGDSRYWGYTEDDALKYFLENINKLNFNIKEIVIRPHPSDYEGKYLWALDHKLISSISSEKSLIQDIAASDIIVGCESMAMVAALAVNKKVISCIPPLGKKCALPHKEIINFVELLKKFN